uniref:Uncharacterized protein n=1 Tax=Arundo donax TaxID=35708 RepID=A0A0A9H9Q9_ARUDO
MGHWTTRRWQSFATSTRMPQTAYLGAFQAETRCRVPERSPWMC